MSLNEAIVFVIHLEAFCFLSYAIKVVYSPRAVSVLHKPIATMCYSTAVYCLKDPPELLGIVGFVLSLFIGSEVV